MDFILRVFNLSKTFPPDIEVLRSINFEVKRGEFVSIIGPTGCGKTTLIKIVSGIINEYEGKVEVFTKKKVGVIFQELGLFPWRTVEKNIEVGLEVKGISKNTRKNLVQKYIKEFGLKGFEKEYPQKLSGGMKQKLAIARTLIVEPELILMDEPFASLDFYTRIRMQDFLLDVWQKKNNTILFVTHNVEEAIYLSDKVIVLSKRPAKVISIINISLDRPRRRDNSALFEIYKNILKNFNTNKI